MQRMIYTILLLCLSGALCSDVLELTENDFDTRIKEKELVLVKFYAPWCGHCQKLAPHFDTAAKKLLVDAPNSALAKVDCTTQETICKKYAVSGYPTLKLFRNGELNEEFDGSRDTDGIMDYMLAKSRPSSQEITKAEELSVISKSDKPLVLTYAKSPEDPLLAAHMKVSTILNRKVVFAHTHDASILEKPSTSSVLELHIPKLLHTKLEEPILHYAGDTSDSSIEKWIIKNGHGLVGYRTRNGLIYPSDDYLVLFNNASLKNYPKGVAYYRNRLIKAMKSLGANLPSLTYTYSFSDEYAHELMDMNVEAPAVVVYSSGKKYILREYSHDKLTGFLKEFKEGKLEPFIKSEPIPTEQTGFAKKVVAKNFEEIVNDPTKDAFVVFHAPWCGHCKKFLPDFEKVAEQLKDEPNLVLVTVDATANDVPSAYNVRSFPTSYFVPKDKKSSPVEYTGERTVDALIKYIAEKSTDELRKYDRTGMEKKLDL